MNENDSKIRLILDLVGFKGVEIDEAIASLQHVKDTLDDTAAVGTKAEGSTRNFGRTALETGRIIQDTFQGGISSALNNIEGLSLALGLGGGLAGVLTTLGVLLYAFRPQIESAIEGMGLFGEKVESTTDQLERLKLHIKEIEDKPIKLAVDTLELKNAQTALERLQAAAGGFKALSGLTTEDQRKAGDQVREVLAGAPGGAEAVANALAAAETKRGTEQSKTLQETEREINEALRKIADLEQIPAGTDMGAAARGEIDTTRQRIAALEERRRAARLEIEADAQRRVGGAFSGASAGRAGDRKQLAEMLRASGFGDVADQVEWATPEAVDFQRRRAESEKAATKGVKEREKAEKDAEREQKANEAAGEAIQQMTDAELARQQKAADAEQEERARIHANAGEWAREALAKADRGVKQAVKPITAADAQRMALEGGFAREGLNDQQAAEAAKRSMELQRMGVAAGQANAEALRESVLLNRGMLDAYEAQRQYANRAAREIQAMRNQFTQMNNAVPQANMPW